MKWHGEIKMSNSLSNEKTLCGLQKKEWHWAFGVLLLFTLGFFIFHGREARTSGSWRYVITHNDEYGYWAIAKGASETPTAESNPFYAEEGGRRNTFPYTTSTFTGWLAKLLGVPVMFFFPVWHIGMPFVLWFSLYLCLTRLWRYPAGASAAVALLSLAATLFLRGQCQFILFRYSRPGDGLWLVMFWISLVMHPESRTRKNTSGLIAAVFALIWLHPYFVLPAVTVTLGEMLWMFFKQKDKRAGVWLAGILAALAAATFSYKFYIQSNMSENPWLLNFLASHKSPPELRKPEFISIFFYALTVCGILGYSRFFKTALTKLDRLLLWMLLIGPAVSNVQVFLPHNYHFETHQYYFFPIHIAALIGWFLEKLPRVMALEVYPKWERPAIYLLAGFEIWILLNPATNFFRHLPVSDSHFYAFNHSLLLLGLLPAIVLGTLAYYRLEHAGSYLLKKPLYPAVILAALTLLGFLTLPSQLKENNRAMPYDGAYRWLNQNAKPNEVVLTVSPTDRWKEDYLILYTDQKTYLNLPVGSLVSLDNAAKQYRLFFYNALLLGRLREVPIQGLTTLEEKVKHLRLNYLLLRLPSPFQERIQNEFGDLAEVVYRDDRCLIWKLKV